MYHKNNVNVNICLHVSTLLTADVENPLKVTLLHIIMGSTSGVRKYQKKNNKKILAPSGAYAWIVNPVAVGDEHTYRWYIKTAITRTPGKAKNQSEWIVKPASKNQWGIHVLDHSVIPLNVGGRNVHEHMHKLG